MSGLTLQNVHKSFRGVKVLRGISIELDLGETTGIIGPNGSGKTTLFNIVTGFLRPEAGSIVWDGRNITRRSPHAIARLGLARSFQQRAVFPNFTVYENIEVAALAAGLRGRDRALQSRHSLEALNLEDHAGTRAGSLPFGLARLLGVACLLPQKPRLMLLDEPAAGLADDETAALTSALSRLRDDGYAFCLVDHSMEFVRAFCHRTIVMDAGNVLADGEPDAVMSNPAVIEAYLGAGDAHE
jgi:branched-chain amino acid transport system ATP-binding protein